MDEYWGILTPHTSRAGGADRDWHPGRVKAEGGWSLLVSHRKGRKDRNGFYCPGFASFALFPV